jgi:lysophospholipase L1-like esterase
MSADVLARWLAARAATGAARRQLKASGLKLVTFGHSLSAYGFTADAAATTMLDRGSATWAAVLTGQRLTIDPAGNFGVGGQTIAQILARLGDVLASDADVVELWAGANDI